MKNKTILLTLLLLLAIKSEAHSLYLPECEDRKTTIELSECRQKQIEAAESKLQRYLAAARERAHLFGLSAASIDEEQKLWESYRTKHCGNVYDFWRMGTIRYEMSATCTLEVTRERTIDVWRAYLTYVDSTPPVLPDPSQ
ncbi:MAG: DUF1311 domain-containing protein [Paludibacterium sp.]|uniref:lysozyme inhibitor LprI family protein n=1 Tax=Paludibacterium sp. TaxID=1917523 RepID=UPI00344E8B19|nr:DUF1311 domain-containing protein [Paludibacterium sp.]